MSVPTYKSLWKTEQSAQLKNDVIVYKQSTEPYQVRLLIVNLISGEEWAVPFSLFAEIREAFLPDNYNLNAEELSKDALEYAKEHNSTMENPFVMTDTDEALIRYGALSAAVLIKERPTP